MNNRRRLLQRLTLPDIRPHYNHLERRWKARVHGRTVTGPLDHVAAAYADVPVPNPRESYFPYTLTDVPVRDDWEMHGHMIADILRALLANPTRFTIAGFEDRYSDAERQLLDSTQRRLIKPV